jgi:hypothetical protein
MGGQQRWPVSEGRRARLGAEAKVWQSAVAWLSLSRSHSISLSLSLSLKEQERRTETVCFALCATLQLFCFPSLLFISREYNDRVYPHGDHGERAIPCPSRSSNSTPIVSKSKPTSLSLCRRPECSQRAGVTAATVTLQGDILLRQRRIFPRQ